MPITAHDIGNNIREARRLAGGLRQRDLADRIHKSQTTVAAYEVGDVLPPVDVLESIADATGTSVQWLLFGDEVEVRTTGACLLSNIVASAPGHVSNIQLTLTIDPATLDAE